MRLRLTNLLVFFGVIFSFILVEQARVNGKAADTIPLVPMYAGMGLWQQQSNPSLQISTAVTATVGSVITVPIDYLSNKMAVTSLAFSLDIDQTCLAFDPADHDGNGQPDALSVHIPPGMNVSVAVDLLDEDGEVDIILADFFPPFVTLPDRTPLLEITLRTVCQVAPGTTQSAAIRFASNPVPSFGNASGAPVAVRVTDGWVTISGPPLPPTATPTPTLIATPTLIPTKPPATPTLVATVPAPVTVVEYFRAIPQSPYIHLQWQTVQEVETAGFYIYRRQVEDSSDFLLVSHLLPAQGAKGLYTFIDQTVQSDDHYLYLLVEEKNNGLRTEFIKLITVGTLAAQQPYQLLLPLITL